MPTNDTTLTGKVVIDDSDVKRIPATFNAATSAANKFAEGVGRADSAVGKLGRNGAGGGGGVGAWGKGFRDMRMGAIGGIASNLAGQSAQFLDSDSRGSQVLSIGQAALSGGAMGGMVGGPIGAALGASASAIVASFVMLKTTTDQLDAAMADFNADLKRGQTAVARHADIIIEALTSIDQRGFSGIERDALARLLAEQIAGKAAGTSADIEDTQSTGDRMIVELAKAREATERLEAYFKSKGYAPGGGGKDILRVGGAF